ncbi:hypothetical protein [Flavipsychrobacter stenotrophus]|uniref:hypothetical protein n=1 Tax=Flavipsychrobacter stenotrophus TaxID=2077091 RepID=UPI0010575D2F|nr:hypothetical protein [Flavipsychrobacter stenotrophus]
MNKSNGVWIKDQMSVSDFRQWRFFAFPAVFFDAFPVYSPTGNRFTGFRKPPVSAVFRSFSTSFRQFLPVDCS